MPKDYRERRIDIEPVRGAPSTLLAKRTTTETPVPDDVTTPAFPEPEESPIEMIFEFEGGGAPGAAATFNPPVPLASGDLYLIAYAYAESSGGGVSISPSLVTWTGPGSATDRGGVTTRKVSYAQRGATSFTVTVSGASATAYHGWVLRGVQLGFSAPLTDYTHDEALVSYTGAVLPDPNVCLNPVTKTDWSGAAVLASPGAGAFGVYAATARMGPCDEAAPMPSTLGGSSVSATGIVDGIVGYEFGRVSGGAGSMTIDATSGKHGTWAGVTMFAVAPLPV